MKKSVHIISTKSLNPELIHWAASAGITISQADFIQTTIRVQDNLNRDSIHPVIVLTSKTGVQAWMGIVKKFGLDLKQYTVYCLAFGTQALAVKNGLRIAGVGQDSASLAEVVLNDKSISRVSFICGNLRRDELPNKLMANGIQVQEISAYRTDLTPIEIQDSYQGILFFSPSAIDSFLSLNKNTNCPAFCIGGTTANHAQKVGFSTIQVADISAPESMVEKVIHYYKNQIIHA